MIKKANPYLDFAFYALEYVLGHQSYLGNLNQFYNMGISRLNAIRVFFYYWETTIDNS